MKSNLNENILEQHGNVGNIYKMWLKLFTNKDHEHRLLDRVAVGQDKINADVLRFHDNNVNAF
jgi:hypothetical protein